MGGPVKADPAQVFGDEPLDSPGRHGLPGYGKSGQSFEVAVARSIFETLESYGVLVPFSCHEGMCGTCDTAV